MIAQKMAKKTFDIRLCEFDKKMKEICNSYGSKTSQLLSYIQTHSENQESLTHSVPLIFQSHQKEDTCVL